MEKKKKFSNWFKKYGTYVTAGALVVALGAAVIVTGASGAAIKASNSAKNPVVSVSAVPISFSMPMADATLIKDFSGDELLYNATLGRWEFHDGIDLTSASAKVFAVADGEVTDVATDNLLGTTITIKHANMLVSTYGSLSQNVLVQKGDKVRAGDEIGQADNSASSEMADGKHLHFGMLENNKKIDPASYLELAQK